MAFSQDSVPIGEKGAQFTLTPMPSTAIGPCPIWRDSTPRIDGASALARIYVRTRRRTPGKVYDKAVPAEWFADTDPAALAIYLRLHREMSPGQRLARVFELCDLQQSLQMANVRATYPQAGEQEIFLRVAARRLGREVMIKAYSWDPALHP